MPVCILLKTEVLSATFQRLPKAFLDGSYINKEWGEGGECLTSHYQTAHLIYRGTNNPRQSCGVNGGEQGPTPRATFVANGHNGGYAREVKQHEDEVGIAR